MIASLDSLLLVVERLVGLAGLDARPLATGPASRASRPIAPPALLPPGRNRAAPIGLVRVSTWLAATRAEVGAEEVYVGHWCSVRGS
jgi:hypothetical protein